MPVLRTFAIGLVGATLLFANEAMAAASLFDCDKITNDDAFNKCLASFGPRPGQHADPNDPNILDADDPPPGTPARAVTSTSTPVTGPVEKALEKTEDKTPAKAREAGRSRSASAAGTARSVASSMNRNGITVTRISGGRYRFHIPMRRR